MRKALTSYRKSILAASVAALAVISVTLAGQTFAPALVPAPVVFSLAAAGWALGAVLLLVALGGLLVYFRHTSRERGEEDLFLALNRVRSEAALSGSGAVALPWLRRWLCSPAVVGDTVRIRSLQEISATLDADGRLDGLPFMPEMAKYCGSTGIVFRYVDKIYDYGGRKDMRRMKDAVSIAGLRCDGGAHDGCQARCYLLWKTAWIERIDAPAVRGGGDSIGRGSAAASNASARPTGPAQGADAADRRYTCQFTELARASTRMSPWDPRQDLRPLIAGNVTTSAFAVAMLTRLFNMTQRLRRGIDYPPAQRSSSDRSPRVDLDLQPGEVVRVREPEKIFETLDKTGRNRGLWFDLGMLKYSKESYKVLARVEKIIDDASGRMLRMKTPCVTLDGVDAAGEHMRFCPQHDYPFWREAWLERVASGADADTTAR